MDGSLGEKVVLVSADHSLSEEEVDPLCHVVLVLGVVLDGEFEEAVDQAADLRDRVLLGQVFILIEPVREGIDEAVDE